MKCYCCENEMTYGFVVKSYRYCSLSCFNLYMSFEKLKNTARGGEVNGLFVGTIFAIQLDTRRTRRIANFKYTYILSK